MAPSQNGHEIANRILLALPQATLARIAPALETVNLARGQVIYAAGKTIERLYFVNRGLISFVKTMQDGRMIEIGAVGIEGVTHPSALFDIDDAALDAIVQVPGLAFRVRREILQEEMAQSGPIRNLMRGFTHFTFGKLAQTAACNCLHSLEERCCRWLLMAHDSARADTFPLTHEFLAMMLGVQRSGVSLAAGVLQKAGLINYLRGHVTVTDRLGLEAAACECYGTIRAQLDYLFVK